MVDGRDFIVVDGDQCALREKKRKCEEDVVSSYLKFAEIAWNFHHMISTEQSYFWKITSIVISLEGCFK